MKKISTILICTLCFFNRTSWAEFISSDEYKYYIDGNSLAGHLGFHDSPQAQKRLADIVNKTTTEEKHQDCKQAFEQAKQRSKEIFDDLGTDDIIGITPDDSVYSHAILVNHERNKKDICTVTSKVSDYDIFKDSTRFFKKKVIVETMRFSVSGFVEGFLFKKSGIFLDNNSDSIFLYTKNTNYTTDQDFKSDYILKRVGNYKYKTTSGYVRSIPAYKETKYKLSEIMPIAYKKDPTLLCAFDSSKNVVFWTGDPNYQSFCWARKNYYEEDVRF